MSQNENVKHIHSTDKDFIVSNNLWMTELSSYTYAQFLQFYSKQRQYFFRGTKYHTIDKSFELADGWLNHQASVGKVLLYNEESSECLNQ